MYIHILTYVDANLILIVRPKEGSALDFTGAYGGFATHQGVTWNSSGMCVYVS